MKDKTFKCIKIGSSTVGKMITIPYEIHYTNGDVETFTLTEPNVLYKEEKEAVTIKGIPCKECQEVNPENAEFCHHCGKKMKDKSPKWMERYQKPEFISIRQIELPSGFMSPKGLRLPFCETCKYIKYHYDHGICVNKSCRKYNNYIVDGSNPCKSYQGESHQCPECGAWHIKLKCPVCGYKTRINWRLIKTWSIAIILLTLIVWAI